jgi:hypothetical protein
MVPGKTSRKANFSMYRIHLRWMESMGQRDAWYASVHQ